MKNPVSSEFTPRHYLELEKLCDQFEVELRENNPSVHECHDRISAYVKLASAEIRLALGHELNNILRDHEACIHFGHRDHSSGKQHPNSNFSCEASNRTVSTLSNTDRGESGSVHANITESKKFGRLTLESIVGRGGSGVVWRAFDEALNRLVALKISHPYSAAESKRFVREAQSVASLKHSNIIPIYEAGEFEGRCYIISEFCEGESLSELLGKKTIPPREAVELMTSVSSAIAHSHHKGIIHRDLKPQNILIHSDGRPLVTDFGLAKRLGHDQTLTLDGEIVGTPAYMAPEQASGGGARCDERTDIYSLGVIFFQLLTGSLPFAGSFERIVFQVIHSPAPNACDVNPEVPKDLAAICAKCIEKDPKQRFQSVGALIEEFDRYLAGESIRTRKISAVGRYTRWLKREPEIAWSLSMCIAVLFLATLGASVSAWAMNRAWQKEKTMLAQTQSALAQAIEAGKKEAEAKQRATDAEARTKQQAEIARRLAQVNRREANFLTDLFAPLDLVGVNQSASENGQSPSIVTVETINYVAAKADELPAEAFVVRARVLGILANAWRSRGRFDKAEKLLREALNLLSNREESNASVLAGDFALNHLYWGYLHHQRGQMELAKNAYLKSIELHKHWATNNPEDVVCQLQIAQAEFGLGVLHMRQRRNDLAHPRIKTALEIRRKHLSKKDPLLTANVLAMHQCTPSAEKGELIRILADTDDRYSQKAMRLYWRLLQQRKHKDYEASIATYEELIELIEVNLGMDNPVYLLAVGDFSGLLRKAGKYELAFEYAEKAITGSRDFAPWHRQRMSAMMLLAHELGLAKRHDEALNLLLEVSKSESKHWASSNELHLEMAWCYFHLKKFEKAVAKSSPPLNTVGKITAAETAWIYFTHANMLEAIGKSDESRTYFDKSLHEVECLAKQSRLPEHSTWLSRIGKILAHHGLHERAEAVYRQAIETGKREYFAAHPRVSGLQVELAKILIARDSQAEAAPLLTQAFAAQTKQLPKNDKRILATSNLLSKLSLSKEPLLEKPH